VQLCQQDFWQLAQPVLFTPGQIVQGHLQAFSPNRTLADSTVGVFTKRKNGPGKRIRNIYCDCDYYDICLLYINKTLVSTSKVKTKI
jgi:hypothetical protein